MFGGMFDPVHAGHLAAARYARDALGLDTVLLVPCKRPNHRDGAFASGEQRLEMLELACAGEAGLEASPIELQRDSVSYSVDTLAQLRAESPGSLFVFLLGLDAFASLTAWERWRELLDDNLLAVFSRPGATLEPEVEESLELAARRADTPEALFCATRGRVILLDKIDHALSSTAVRKALASGGVAEAGLTQEVSDYICRHGLYA